MPLFGETKTLQWIPGQLGALLALIEPGFIGTQSRCIRLGFMADRVEPDLLKGDFT